MKIVIAGANSFIGKELIKQLSTSHQIVAIVRKESCGEEFINEYANYTQIRYAAMEQYEWVMEDIGGFDCYIPLAWNGTKREDRNDKEKNLKSCENIFRSVKTAVETAGCNKIIMVGTQSMYDEQPNEYGKAKLQCYEKVSEYCRKFCDVKMCEVRLWNVYGPNDKKEKMLNNVIYKFMENQDVHIIDGDKYWDFLHVQDVACAIGKLVEHEFDNGQIYDLLDGRRDSLGNFMIRIKKVCSSDSSLSFTRDPKEVNMLYHIVDAGKAQRELNWQPEVDFEKGILEIIKSIER